MNRATRRLCTAAIAIAAPLFVSITACGEGDKDAPSTSLASSETSATTSATTSPASAATGLPYLGPDATDAELLDAAQAASTALSVCPTFGGGVNCLAGAEQAKDQLNALNNAVILRDGWEPVSATITAAVRTANTLSVTCAASSPTSSTAADCLDAVNSARLLREEMEQAIATVHRNGD